MTTFFDIPVQNIDGTPDLLGSLRGKVVLAVNVASRCGLTPNRSTTCSTSSLCASCS